MGYDDVGGNGSVRWESYANAEDTPKEAYSNPTQKGGHRQKGGDETEIQEGDWNRGFVISLRVPRGMTADDLMARLRNPSTLRPITVPGESRVEFDFPMEANGADDFDQITITWGKDRGKTRKQREPDPDAGAAARVTT